MRLYVLLCYLQLHLYNVEGFHSPIFKIVPRIIQYIKGDTLSFEVFFKDFPQLPREEYWMSTVYYVKHSRNPSQTGTNIATDPHRRLLKSEKHIYIKVLEVVDDRTDLFVKVENEEEAFYYEEKIITLQHQQNRTDETKKECLDKLNKCPIIFNIWNPKKNKVSLITEPKLSNVTFYRVGDRFSHNCTRTASKGKHTNFSWIRQKDNHYFNSSMSSSVIDIILNESYKNTEIRCVAQYLSEPEYFDETFVATKLILLTHQPEESSVPWYIISIAVAALALVSVAALAHCCTKRTLDHVVEVQNELYADSGLQYAQLYEVRGARGERGAPPPHRAPYSNVIGYLHADT